MKKKSEYTHRHIFLDNDVDLKLRLCMEKRNMKAAKHYIEQLIVDDFERQQRGQTGPESTQIVDRLSDIKALLIPILEHIFITRQLSFFTAKTVITLPGEVEKMPENEAGKFFKTAMEEALKNLRKEVGY